MAMLRRIGVLLVALLVLAAVAAVVLYVKGREAFVAPGPSTSETVMVVPKGAGVERIATLLRDAGVIAFLAAEAEVQRMEDDIARFVADWLPSYARDNRVYLTVAIGCTGGQHRSVYLAEKLAARFRSEANVLVRHRNVAA